MKEAVKRVAAGGGILCMAIAMTLSAAEATAQSTTPGTEPVKVEVTLEDALSIALEENPTILIADMEIERQQYFRKEAVGGLLPTLTAEGQYSRYIKSSKMAGMDMPMDNQFDFGGNLNLPLFAPGVWQNIKLSKEQILSAVESARGSRISLITEVKKAFYNILMTEESLRVLRESESNISRTVDETQLKYDNGLASEYDLITAQVQLSNLKPNIIQTQTAIDVSKMMLKMLMGLPQDVELSVSGQLDNFANIADTVYNDMGLPLDIDNNSELKSLDIQKLILERQLKLQQTQRMPTLAAFGSWSASGNDLDMSGTIFGSGMRARKHKFDWQTPATVGLRVSVPLFAGFTNTFKAKQMRNSIQQLQLQRDYRAESLAVEVNSAVANIYTYREQMLANRKTIDQAQKGYDISRTRQSAGMGTMLEVNTAELSLTQARLNYTQAVYDYLTAVAEYDKVIGKDFEITENNQ